MSTSAADTHSHDAAAAPPSPSPQEAPRVTRRYEHVITALRQPWAIRSETLDIIVEVVRSRARGERLSDAEIRAKIAGAAPAPANRVAGSVAVIPIFGVIAHRMNMMTAISGGTSTEELASQLRIAIADPQVESIVFDVDSPGGSVAGIQELGDLIYEARGRKPLVAVANATAASAAYWLASQADRLVVTPSGQVGSIGVLAVHEDLSKQAEMLGVKTTYINSTDAPYKTEGQPFVPLTDEARAELQRKVDSYHDAFRSAVARGRGVKPSVVDDRFGGGRMLTARDAVKAGMADDVATLDDVIAELRAHTGQTRGTTVSARATASATDAARPDTVEPDENGNCPDGYEKAEGGVCRLVAAASPSGEQGRASMATPGEDIQVRDGEIVVSLAELNTLRVKAARADQIDALHEDLQHTRSTNAELVAKQREDRIRYRVMALKIPAFRAFAKAFYDMAAQMPTGKTYEIVAGQPPVVPEALVDAFVAACNKQADSIFRSESVDVRPIRAGIDPDEPEAIGAKVEYRIGKYLREHKLDRSTHYRAALTAVLNADPELKEAYRTS